MDWLNKSIDFVKSNFNVLLIVVYIISYANYYIYYGNFNIDIVSYISLTDLLFYPLKLALGIFFAIIIIDLVLSFAFTFTSIFVWRPYMTLILKTKRFSMRSEESRRRLRKIRHNYTNENDFKEFLAFIGSIACMFLKFDIVIILFPSLIVYMALLLGHDEKGYHVTTTMAIIVLLGTMLITSVYGVYDKRYLKDDYSISFIENNTRISTDEESSTINYLGQSSDYIFLYDIEKKTSLIYSKSNISDIRIKENERSGRVIDFLREHIDKLAGKSED